MDDRMLVGAGTGVATYARALRKAQHALDPDAQLLTAGRIGPVEKASRYLRAFVRRGQGAWRSGADFLCPDVYELSHVYFAIHKRLLPIRVPGPPGLMHWSYPIPARLVGWTNLYTVHDLIPINQPDLTPLDADKHRRILAQIGDTGGRIITVSDASRRELAALPETARVPTWNCSQPVDVAGLEPVAGPLPAGLQPGGYLLLCGTIEPRKNIERTVRAYNASGIDLPLVIAGPDGWRAQALMPLFDPADGIVRLPYQDRTTLLALIRGARALLFVSLAEGFGLPVLEAMALGTPVLTSREGALAEIAGDAALTVDPYSESAISAAIRRLASDDPCCRMLAARGRKRAQAFTHDGFVRRLSEAYWQALQPDPCVDIACTCGDIETAAPACADRERAET